MSKSFFPTFRLAKHRFPLSIRRIPAFSVTEVLVVMAIMVTVMGFVAPAFTGLKGSGDVTKAAYEIAGALENARAYAVAKNTYVWVGFFEENASSSAPGTAGTGRIVVGMVASRDGTKIYNPTSLSALPEGSLIPVNKLVKIDNMHLKTFSAGTGTGGGFDARPVVGGIGAQIGDTSPSVDSETPFTTGQYTFTKAIEFNPRGEARVNNADSALQPVVEIGLQPAHGSSPDDASRNVAAVQVTGVAGNVKIFRR